jgi:hypothetical protein
MRTDDLRAALAAEEDWQRTELAAIGKRPWAEQVSLGAAWPEMAVERAEPGRRGRWTWTARARTPLHDGIGPGETVAVGSAGAARMPWRGHVVAVEDRVAEIAVRTEDEPPAAIRVARRFDPTTFGRMREAIDRVAALDTPLSRILLGRDRWEVAEPRPVAIPGLDASQQVALGRALAAQALAVIYGPPGTGKTRTLVALLGRLVAEGDRPWALADSNAAADHLAAETAASGLVVVRVGPVARIGARAAALTLDARLQSHPLRAAIAGIDRDLIRLRANGSWSERRALNAERDRLEDLARTEILASAQVVATTLGSLGRYASQLPPAHTAVVDEATQATEPATWIAVPHVQRLILAGDPHQLGPVVFAPHNPLADSLLQRLLADAPAAVEAGMLEVQRRMHADIHALVAPVYGPRYRPDPSVAERSLGGPVVRFVDTAGADLEDARDPVTASFFNPGETRVVALAVQAWRAAGVAAEDIGVIAPYSAQVARLAADPALVGVEVATVNAFQGREKDAIAISLVRSNEAGETGFALDARRLVVALSRARKALVIVGDSATIGRTREGAALLARLAPEAVETVWAEPWVEALGEVSRRA